MNGFILKVTKADRLSPGGKYTITWITIGTSAEAVLARPVFEGAEVVEQGPAVLRRAKALGLSNGGLRRLDL